LEKKNEAVAKEEIKDADPDHFEELSKFPAFLCIRAKK